MKCLNPSCKGEIEIVSGLKYCGHCGTEIQQCDFCGEIHDLQLKYCPLTRQEMPLYAKRVQKSQEESEQFRLNNERLDRIALQRYDLLREALAKRKTIARTIYTIAETPVFFLDLYAVITLRAEGASWLFSLVLPTIFGVFIGWMVFEAFKHALVLPLLARFALREIGLRNVKADDFLELDGWQKNQQLKTLREVSVLEDSPAALLRSAQAPEDEDPATLLKAASAGETPAQELLRTVEVGND